MIEVYYYITAPKAENAVECGLKLSEWFNKEVVINGENRKCIAALLNPKDDIEKYKSSEYKCLKFSLMPNYCFIGDSLLYEVGLVNPEAMKAFNDSIVPIEKYIFGSYRLPECLVTSTVIPGQIDILDKRLDSPVLFDNSEELYMNNVIETYKEQHNDFSDALLYYFHCKLTELGKFRRIENREKRLAVFINKADGKTVTIKIPDMSAY